MSTCRSQEEVVWTLIDQTLDSLFDSVGSSRSATPSTSALVTPRSSGEDTGRNSQDSERELPSGGGGVVVNTSSSSALFSTPQSVSSDRYALPSALARVELDQYQSDSSLTDLQGSGVFYSLVPDDTASVTDSEVEFKVPPAVSKAGGRHVAFDPSASTAARKRRCTPPKLNTDLSLFVSKDLIQGQDPSLLSPKLHRESREEEDAGLKAADVMGGKASDASRWKEVDGEGWMAAVGGSNLWQAYTDLRSLEMEEKEPRRQLRFASQSFLDNYTDSDGSSVSDGKGRPHGKSDNSASRSQARSPSKHAGSVLSRSEDFTRPGKVRQHKTSVKKVVPGETTVSRTMQPQPTPSQRSTQSAHINKPRDLSLMPSRDSQPNTPLPTKLLLNPKDFLSRPVRKTSPGERQEDEKGAETLDSMLERLGIGGGHSRAHRSHSAPGKKLQSSQGRKSDSFVSGRSTKYPVDVTLSDRAMQPRSDKSKSRTHSADSTSSKQLRVSHQHRPGKATHSEFAPQQSDQPPSFKASQPKRHGHRRDREVVQRSLEDLHVNFTHSPLSHSSKVKSRSEQALHVLSEAFCEEEGKYSYTPLKHFLPPPSPSTSLLSTYSVSEGDLRHLPHRLAEDGERF